jgi:hypothetical protein
MRYESASCARAGSARAAGHRSAPPWSTRPGHVGRREIAALQASLRRPERAAEELRGLFQHPGALLGLLEVEVGRPRRGELLAQHVERVALRRQPQPGRGVQAQRALVAALERLVDAEHGVRPLGAARDAGAVDRERRVGASAGDHRLRIGGLECAPRRQQARGCCARRDPHLRERDRARAPARQRHHDQE